MNGTLSRRQLTARLAALGLATPALTASAQQASARQVATPTNPSATPVNPGGTLTQRGINYDVGTNYDHEPGYISRPDAHRAWFAGEIAAIHDDLHCTTIGIYGSDPDRLIEAATLATGTGLQVRLQPRILNEPIEQLPETVAGIASTAASLDTPVIFDLGCELSLFASGIIPGTRFDDRLAYLVEHLDELPVINEKLNALLASILTGVRDVFPGQVVYSSGAWEAVDWSGIDIVGVDLYRDTTNAATYVEMLRTYLQHGKPVWITEFGCCTYEGAQDLGASGYGIVDWTTTPPSLNDSYTRSESVQATYLNDLLTIFEQEGVEGAFIYQFIDPELPHIPDDPQHDLDMASFGIVKTYGAGSDQPYDATGYWEPKEAFSEIASRYGAPGTQPGATPVPPAATPIPAG